MEKFGFFLGDKTENLRSDADHIFLDQQCVT